MSTALVMWGALIAPFALGAPAELGMPEADDAPGDGIYGRLDGDFSLSVGLGAEIDATRSAGRPSVGAALRYYQAIGVLLHYAQGVHEGDPLERRLVAGFLLEPLFLLRWPEFSHSGRAFPDLFFDSFGLHVGTALIEPRGGDFAQEVRLNVGAGLGIPLTCRAPGPFIRARYDLELLGAEPVHNVLLNLEWQFFWESPWLKRSLDRVGP